MERNEKNSSTIASDFQTTSESFQLGTSPLKGAFIHISQAKLLLRRARAESLGHDRCECLTRLLQSVDCIGASIAWLGGDAPQGKVDPAIHAIDGNLTSAGALL
jgi:hypothetical protein